MKYTIRAFHPPHALVEYSSDDDQHSEYLNVRIDKNLDGSLPQGAELDTFILSFAPQLPRTDPFIDTDWGAIAALVVPHQITLEQRGKVLEAAVDRHVDAEAGIHGYDNRITCTMRAGYANPWQVECITFARWMDACYAHGIQVQKDVVAGRRPIPTEEELIAELPAMVWP